MDRGQVWIAVDGASCRVSRGCHLLVDHFRLSPGQHWCLFGGNGAGKSLLAAYLAGRLQSGSGRIRYPGNLDPDRDIVTVSFEEQQELQSRDQRHDISEYTPSATDAGTTVQSLVSGNGPAEYADWLIEQLGLRAILPMGIRVLSSGQMRRALLAAALSRCPRLLILDEPLESIDRQSRDRITATIRQWQTSDNASLVLNRRCSSLLPGMTHMALMQDLALVRMGRFEELEHRLEEVLPALPPLPDGLPPPAPGHEPEMLPADVPLIELRGVSVRYGDHTVLDELDWIVWSDHHVLIEGPNGCGKSTLLGLLTGDNHKAYGQDVRLFGRKRGSGESVWEVKSRFGIVSNELHNRYVRGWKVLEVVVSGFFDSVGLYEDAGASEIATAREWLAATGLGGSEGAAYHELSFGQQRLVLLARAMVKQPPVLVLDEPCVGLDDRYRSRMLMIMDRIARTGYTRLLYVSHTTGEAPQSINQCLRFMRQEDGSFRVSVSSMGDGG